MDNKVTSDGIRSVRDGQVVTLHLEGVPAERALDLAALASLRSALLDLRDDATVRVVIITGNGTASFSSGADLDTVSRMSTDELSSFVALANETTLLIETLGKPVIAAINGSAIGLGLEIALACHIRIAARAATFSVSELGGGIPVCGFSRRLTNITGAARALELMLAGNGNPLNADRALELDIVNRVVESDSLCDEVISLARDMARSAPLAMKFVLEMNQRGSTMSSSDALELEAELFSECFDTEDMREGVRAFLEKRQPHFKGE